MLFEVYGSETADGRLTREVKMFKEYNPGTEESRAYWAGRWAEAVGYVFGEVVREAEGTG
jgi:hypothetical protein